MSAAIGYTRKLEADCGPRVESGWDHPCQWRVSRPVVNYLVMEYLEGETLAERLEKGALPVPRRVWLSIALGSVRGLGHPAICKTAERQNHDQAHDKQEVTHRAVSVH